MKREIKFRGKSKISGKWLYGDYLRNRGNHFIAPPGIADPTKTWEDFEIDPDTLGQYTGLKDKDGKEIYEGDIVKWDDESNGRYWRYAEVCISPDIQFDCSRVKSVDGDKNSTSYVFCFGSFAYKDTRKYLYVIGNIHDKTNIKVSK